MKQSFEFGSTEKLFERIAKDKELQKLVDDIVFKCKQASDKGIPMDELASACTLGWFMGQDPQVQKIYDFIVANSKLSN